jgi:hypothetical protein
MTATGQGRFCNACSKEVIDFTAWSDAALYRFFAKNKGGVCGRFLNTQLNVRISIPHQPHSRLYRMTIALGLTLICTQTPALLAQSRPPKATHTIATRSTALDKDIHAGGSGTIYGNVSDEYKEPLINATIQVYQDGILKGSNVSDFDGNYAIKPLVAGPYEVLITYVSYDTVQIKNVIVGTDTTIQNVRMKKKPVQDIPYSHINKGVISGLVDSNPFTEIYGNVTDKQGKPLFPVEVQVYQSGKALISQIADTLGRYDFTDLKPGTYELHILCQGYKVHKVKGLHVGEGRKLQDIVMHKKL